MNRHVISDLDWLSLCEFSTILIGQINSNYRCCNTNLDFWIWNQVTSIVWIYLIIIVFRLNSQSMIYVWTNSLSYSLHWRNFEISTEGDCLVVEQSTPDMWPKWFCLRHSNLVRNQVVLHPCGQIGYYYTSSAYTISLNGILLPVFSELVSSEYAQLSW